jgi:hypothetical protein
VYARKRPEDFIRHQSHLGGKKKQDHETRIREFFKDRPEKIECFLLMAISTRNRWLIGFFVET